MKSVFAAAAAAALACLLTGLWSGSASAIYVRDDLAQVGTPGVGLDDYEAVGALYPATGYFWNAAFNGGAGGEWCTGTIFHYSSGFTDVLTAAHCVRGFDLNNDKTISAAEAVNLSFQLGNNGNLNGAGFGVVEGWYAPTYAGGVRPDDMAILVINADSPAFGNFFSPLSFVDPTTLVGFQSSIVGWGNQGTGLANGGAPSPPLSVTDGFGYTAKDKLGAQNIVDAWTLGLLVSDFDDPLNADGINPLGGAFPLNFEGTTASGDSGGPLLPVGLAPGAGGVAGVLSGGLKGANANCVDSSLYNDCSAWASVWNNRAFIWSHVPEPATLALLGLGFAGLGLSRRRQ